MSVEGRRFSKGLESLRKGADYHTDAAVIKQGGAGDNGGGFKGADD